MALISDWAALLIVDGIAAAYWAAGGVMLLAAIAAFTILRRTQYADDSAEPAAAPA